MPCFAGGSWLGICRLDDWPGELGGKLLWSGGTYGGMTVEARLVIDTRKVSLRVCSSQMIGVEKAGSSRLQVLWRQRVADEAKLCPGDHDGIRNGFASTSRSDMSVEVR